MGATTSSTGCNIGYSDPVDASIIQLRVHVGACYRVYCAWHREAVPILPCGGGDKASQMADIKRAKELWWEWKRGQS